MIKRSQRRLILALGASTLLHAWLMHTGDGSSARRAPIAGGELITATLTVSPVGSVAFEPQTRNTLFPQRKVVDVVESRRGAVTAAAPVAVERPPAQHATTTIDSPAVLAQPSDPTYYTARSLDVYPKAITALNLGSQPGAGKVRATVLIDESGVVNDVRAIEASAAEIASAARDLLLRTRFTAATKDGRLVKAQLLVSLDYEATQRHEAR